MVSKEEVIKALKLVVDLESQSWHRRPSAHSTFQVERTTKGDLVGK